MSYAIEFVPRAWKELHALPDDEAARIESRIRLLADDPRANAVKLAGEENLWRIRIGNYRVVYEIRDAVLLVLIVRIGHRRDIYRKR